MTIEADIKMPIERAIERLKLCSNNQCNICGRYEKEECILERNRCEKTLINYVETMHSEFDRLEGIEDNTAMLKMELETSKKETQQVLDDYQDLGKEHYKLQCELEKAEQVIDVMAKELHIEGYCKNIKCKKCEAKNFVECIKDYFYKKVSDNK